MVTSPLPTERRKPPLTMIVVLAAICAAAAIIYFVFLHGAPAAPGQISLTPEAKAYVKNLDLSGVEMKATENMLKTTLVEITGHIGNKGTRPLRSVEIVCIFYDPYGQEVHRERVPIVRARGQVLKPAEYRDFRLPFENLPPNWNQRMPQMVIASVVFGD